jgi:hypothetical protein
MKIKRRLESSKNRGANLRMRILLHDEDAFG